MGDCSLCPATVLGSGGTDGSSSDRVGGKKWLIIIFKNLKPLSLSGQGAQQSFWRVVVLALSTAVRLAGREGRARAGRQAGERVIVSACE